MIYHLSVYLVFSHILLIVVLFVLITGFLCQTIITWSANKGSMDYPMQLAGFIAQWKANSGVQLHYIRESLRRILVGTRLTNPGNSRFLLLFVFVLFQST